MISIEIRYTRAIIIELWNKILSLCCGKYVVKESKNSDITSIFNYFLLLQMLIHVHIAFITKRNMHCPLKALPSSKYNAVSAGSNIDN